MPRENDMFVKYFFEKYKHTEKLCAIIILLYLHKHIDQYLNQIKMASFVLQFS